MVFFSCSLGKKIALKPGFLCAGMDQTRSFYENAHYALWFSIKPVEISLIFPIPHVSKDLKIIFLAGKGYVGNVDKLPYFVWFFHSPLEPVLRF